MKSPKWGLALDTDTRARGAAIGFGTTALLLLGNGLSGVLTARLLGPSGKGILALALTWLSLSTALAAIGTGQALAYSASGIEQKESRNIDELRALWGDALRLGAVLGCLGILVMILLSRVTLRDSEASAVVAIGILGLPISLTSGLQLSVLRGLGRYKSYGIAFAAHPLLWILLVIGLFSFHITEVRVILIAFIASMVGSLGLGGHALWGLLGSPHFGTVARLRSHIAYGLPVWASGIAMMTNARLDQLVIGVVGRPEQLGFYSVAVGLATVVSPLASGVALVVLPEMRKSRSASQRRIFLIRSILFSTFLSCLVALVLFSLSETLIPLIFGSAFGSSIRPFEILVFAQVLLGVNLVLHDALRGLGKPILPAIAETVALLVTIPALLAVVPRWGIIGAAIVSLTAYAISTFLLIIFIFSSPGLREPGPPAEDAPDLPELLPS